MKNVPTAINSWFQNTLHELIHILPLSPLRCSMHALSNARNRNRSLQRTRRDVFQFVGGTSVALFMAGELLD
jgi:hypothetical protein